MLERLDFLAALSEQEVAAGRADARVVLRGLELLRERFGPGAIEPVPLERLSMPDAALLAHIRAERDGLNPDWDVLAEEIDWMMRAQDTDLPPTSGTDPT